MPTRLEPRRDAFSRLYAVLQEINRLRAGYSPDEHYSKQLREASVHVSASLDYLSPGWDHPGDG